MTETKIRRKGESIEVSGPGANDFFFGIVASHMADPEEIRTRIKEAEAKSDCPASIAERRMLRARLEELTT